jgi:methionyl-tRNA formyltransferase
MVLVGHEPAGAPTLELVAGSGHELLGVLTDHASPAADAGPGLAAAAAERGVPTWSAVRVADPGWAAELRAREVDVVLCVGSRFVFCPPVLAAPRVGTFNLHLGPLPECAGWNTASWAIVEGRDRHGVTLHWMDAGLGTGDVVARVEVGITARDTGATLTQRCARLGMALVSDLLDQLADDPAGVPRRAQDLTRRRWFGRGAPHRGWIPWSAPARAVLGFVRAFDHGPSASPWGTPRALVSGRGEIGVERLAATGWAAGRPAGEVRTRPGDDGLYVARRRVAAGAAGARRRPARRPQRGTRARDHPDRPDPTRPETPGWAREQHGPRLTRTRPGPLSPGAAPCTTEATRSHRGTNTSARPRSTARRVAAATRSAGTGRGIADRRGARRGRAHA